MRKKNITLIITLILVLFSCKKEDCPDNDNNNGGVNPNTEYTIKAKIVNGTTGNPLYTPNKITMDLDYNDGLGRPKSRLNIASTYMDDKTGEFTLKYKHQALGFAEKINYLQINVANQRYTAIANKNIDTIIYESNQGYIYIFIKTEGYSNNDTLYTGYWEKGDVHPTFDTIPLPFNGLYKDFTSSNQNNQGAISYMINSNLQGSYNYSSKGFDKNLDKLKDHYYYIRGDPYKDTTTLVLKK